MTFEISLSDHFFSQRWAALKEVSAAVAAATGKGVLGLPAFHAARTGVPSIPQI
jgi:hypothetical protein